MTPIQISARVASKLVERRMKIATAQETVEEKKPRKRSEWRHGAAGAVADGLGVKSRETEDNCEDEQEDSEEAERVAGGDGVPDE